MTDRSWTEYAIAAPNGKLLTRERVAVQPGTFTVNGVEPWIFNSIEQAQRIMTDHVMNLIDLFGLAAPAYRIVKHDVRTKVSAWVNVDD